MPFTKDQLLPGEKLIILTREHALILLKPILLNVICVAVLVSLSIQTQKYWFMFFCIAPFAYLLWEWLVWWRREYIVSDRRVVKQEGVLSISSFDAPLDKINNVFHEQTMMGRLFRYGTVGLETASEQGTTVFDFLPHPVEFKNSIVAQREIYRSFPGSQNRDSSSDVPRLLEELASLRDRNIISAAEFEEKKKALLGRI